MISLWTADACLDALCPAWRRDVLNGKADIDFQGKQVWDQNLTTYVDVVPRPLTTTGFKMTRTRGLVREFVLTTATSSWIKSWPYLSPGPGIASVETVAYLILAPDAIMVPGQQRGSTAYNMEAELRAVLSVHGVWRGLSTYVGTDKEVKAWLKVLAEIII